MKMKRIKKKTLWTAFSVGWNSSTKSFSINYSGSYTVSHYVSKCGSGGELTAYWSEMC
jgi:hypothetical protein